MRQRAKGGKDGTVGRGRMRGWGETTSIHIKNFRLRVFEDFFGKLLHAFQLVGVLCSLIRCLYNEVHLLCSCVRARHKHCLLQVTPVPTAALLMQLQLRAAISEEETTEDFSFSTRREATRWQHRTILSLRCSFLNKLGRGGPSPAGSWKKALVNIYRATRKFSVSIESYVSMRNPQVGKKICTSMF